MPEHSARPGDRSWQRSQCGSAVNCSTAPHSSGSGARGCGCSGHGVQLCAALGCEHGSAASLGVCSLCALGAHNFHLSPPLHRCRAVCTIQLQFSDTEMRKVPGHPRSASLFNFYDFISFNFIEFSE